MLLQGVEAAAQSVFCCTLGLLSMAACGMPKKAYFLSCQLRLYLVSTSLVLMSKWVVYALSRFSSGEIGGSNGSRGLKCNNEASAALQCVQHTS
jgi:hypothetical protein